MKKEKEISAESIWEEYQNGIDFLNQHNIFNKTDECYRFFEGRQWEDKEREMYDIISPIVKYKTTIVAQNNVSIVFNNLNYKRPELNMACIALNNEVAKMWEYLKMDTKGWETVLGAAIAGDQHLFFYWDENFRVDSVDNTNILFSDENDSDVQAQKYILIVERKPVEEIKKTAAKYGIKTSEIQPDTNTVNLAGDYAKDEVKNKYGKCISVLRLWKDKDGIVCFCRAIRNMIYEPPQSTGLRKFPVVSYVWGCQKGYCRGNGEVNRLIQNQKAINSGLARLNRKIQEDAFPIRIINESKIDNPEQIDQIGATLRTHDYNTDFDNVIKYIQPAPINAIAYSQLDTLVSKTRELSGASDAATGNINPERASGTAIIAVKEAQALPLNKEVSNYRQFIEDIALIWFDMIVAYNPNGLEIRMNENPYDTYDLIITPEQLDAIEFEIKIDIAPANPYSKYAKEQSLERAMTQGLISFEEYVEALDDDAVAPKGKFLEIINNRMVKQPVNQSEIPQPNNLMTTDENELNNIPFN